MFCPMHWSLVASTTFILVALVLKQSGETTASHSTSTVIKAMRCRNSTSAKAMTKDSGVPSKSKALFAVFNKRSSRNCPLQKRQVIVKTPKVPINQTIQYWFAAEFTAADKLLVRQYVGELQSETCLRFQESTTPLASGISFLHGIQCSATPSYSIGVNIIYAMSQCLAERRLIHEIIHMLGFFHEHQRPDAHQHVQYNKTNIITSQLYQFDEQKTEQLGTPYDYGSIMHYGPTSHINTLLNAPGLTMTTTDSRFQKTIGQRMKLSFLDTYKINKVHCESVCSAAATKCQNGGYPDVNNCQTCNCPSGFGGDTCEEVGKNDVGCGGTLIAESHTKNVTLIDPVANKRLDYSECNWLIKCQDPGYVLRVTFDSKTDSPCIDDVDICQTSYFELKAFKDQRTTGIRYCCEKFPTKFIQTHEQSLLLFRNHKGKSSLPETIIQIQQHKV